MNQLATKSRQYGHNVHLIVQRPKMLDITTRTQCPNLFLFKISLHDTKDLVNEYVADELKNAPSLNTGEFFCKIGADGAVQRGRIF